MFENLVGIQPQYIEERNNKYLMIWPDIPNWLVADKELSTLISMFDLETPINKIIKKVNKDITEYNQFEKILSQLIEIGIVFDRNDGIKSRVNVSKLEDICVHPTLRCNLRCKTCYNRYVIPPSMELSVKEITQFLDQTAEFISDKCCLSILGGEPLLMPEKIIDIAEYARDLGFKRRNISTNGTLVTREFARKASKIELEVQVSLDGVNEETNDTFRGRGSFKKAVKGVRLLREEDAHTVICMTYHSGNYHNLEAFFDLGFKLGVNEVRFAPLKYIGGGGNISVKKIPLDEMIKHSFNMFKNNPHYLSLAGRDHFSILAASCKLGSVTNYCGTGSRMVLLNADGEIYPCINHYLPEFKAGNIREKSFPEIWRYSPILNKLREIYPINKRNNKCSNCAVKYWCLGGCCGETYHVTHSLNSCAIDCASIRKAVIEMFWLLSGDTSFCTKE